MAKKVTNNNKIWEILTAAKKHLSDKPTSFSDDRKGKCQYICDAVSYVLEGGKVHEKPWSEAHEYIHDQLHPYKCLESWLAARDISWDDLDSPDGQIKLQTTRKAWLNHMIKECKARNI